MTTVCANEAKTEEVATPSKSGDSGHNPEIPSSKRSKVGDGPSLGETSCLFHMALCCNWSENEEMIDRVKADKFLDQGSKLQDEQKVSPVPAKSVNCWIGRWCLGGTCSSLRPRSGKAGEEV
ncbi:hypothetical protein ACP70R_039510 [Stipagrostis hirtigluma subsp. patula]